MAKYGKVLADLRFSLWAKTLNFWPISFLKMIIFRFFSMKINKFLSNFTNLVSKKSKFNQHENIEKLLSFNPRSGRRNSFLDRDLATPEINHLFFKISLEFCNLWHLKFPEKKSLRKFEMSQIAKTQTIFWRKDGLSQGWPSRGPESNFCGPILDWNSVIFRYFECFFFSFCQKLAQKVNISNKKFRNSAIDFYILWPFEPAIKIESLTNIYPNDKGEKKLNIYKEKFMRSEKL